MLVILEIAYKFLFEMRICGSDILKSSNTEIQKSFFFLKQKECDHEPKKSLNGTEIRYLPGVKE